MNRIDRYIFHQVFWTTAFVALTLTCVVWLSQSLRFVEMIVNRGLSASMFLYFTMLMTPSFFTVILPVALVMAVIFIYNKLLSDSELVVLRAAGISQFSLAKPAMIVATAATLLCYSLTVYFLPASFREFKDLQVRLRNSFSMVMLLEGAFNTLMKGVTIYVRSRGRSGELYGIFIHDSRDHESPVTIMAERGAIVQGEEGPRVVMVNGNRQEIDAKDGRLSLLYFDRYTFDIGSIGGETGERWREPRERYLSELFFPAEDEKKIWNYQKLRMEGHHRLSMPLLPISFTLIAIALLLSGEYNRRGQTLRILVAVAVVVVMEAALLGLKNMGERAPWVAPLMYLIPIVPAAVCLHVIAPWRRRGRKIRDAVAGGRRRIPT